MDNYQNQARYVTSVRVGSNNGYQGQQAEEQYSDLRYQAYPSNSRHCQQLQQNRYNQNIPATQVWVHIFNLIFFKTRF